MRQLADELAVSFGAPVPALLLGHVAAENARGRSVYNYNVGNISGRPGNGYDVAPAPWADELIDSAPAAQQKRYRELNRRMHEGTVPSHFRAYGHLGAGADAYAGLLTKKRYAPMLNAARADDPRAFARAVVSTGYCADPECGRWETYHALAKEVSGQGLAEYSPADIQGPWMVWVALLGLLGMLTWGSRRG